MPMAFKIRSSKFRHIYGSPAKKELCYENVRITRNTHDSNFCSVNPKFLAVVTETGGGGSFLCIPLKHSGRVDVTTPHVCGHAGVVLDIKFNPFNDNIIASSSEDCTVKVWQIPDGGLKSNLSQWQVDLHGHRRRVGYIDWHPTAENILLSAGFDYKCILWNIEQAEPVNIISCHDNTIFSMSWNLDGSLFSTTCKDKKLRVIDPRIARVAIESAVSEDHGSRAWKSVFLGDSGKVFTVHHNRMSERLVSVWDIKNMTAPLKSETVDSSSSILLPYYDHDTRIVYLGGKGESTVWYFEVDDVQPYSHYLNVFHAPCPQRGFGVMPKRGLETDRCEVMRFYKLYATKNLIEPISMIVPRKTAIFHEDIYVPTASQIPSLSADEWISGQTRAPILMSMLDGHITNSPKVTSAKAVQSQDSSLSQAPTITTYKAVNRPRPEGSVAKQPVESAVHTTNQKSIPASLRNIKQLSTNEDFVSINDQKTNGVEENNNAIQNTESPTENKTENITSPTDQKSIRKIWTPTSPRSAPNGISGGDSESVTHVKKVWSVPQSPTMPQWHSGLPHNEAELKKAYFKQVEEISSLKEQISLKDKRIRQLEEEIELLRMPQLRDDCGPGQSDC